MRLLDTMSCGQLTCPRAKQLLDAGHPAGTAPGGLTAAAVPALTTVVRPMITNDQLREEIVLHAQFCVLWLEVQHDARMQPDLFLSAASDVAADIAARHAVHAFHFAKALT